MTPDQYENGPTDPDPRPKVWAWLALDGDGGGDAMPPGHVEGYLLNPGGNDVLTDHSGNRLTY